jgi:copper transporter 1
LAQKIYTCSEEHAQLVFNTPKAYVADQPSSNAFCYPTGSVMFNGFQLAIGGDSSCMLLLFQPWVVSSAVKYAFAFLGVVLLAFSLEGFGELREHVHKWLLQQHGVVVTQADYVSLAAPHASSASDINAVRLEASTLKPSRVLPASSKVTIIRRLPARHKVILVVLYMA